MKRFVGYLVEGKINGTFGETWLRLGLYRSAGLAELAAEVAPSLDLRVSGTRVTSYFRMEDNGRLLRQAPSAAGKIGRPAVTPLRAADRSRAGEVLRQAV